MKKYKIFIINPGSTSTKLSMFENETELFTESTFHDSSVLLKFPSINDQLDYRMEVLYKFIEDHGVDLSNVDAIVSRGGGCYPIASGVYNIDDRLIQDTREYKSGFYHASMLGVQMAKELHLKYGGRMFTMDPPIVDELSDIARVTGVDGIYRMSSTHALNIKEVSRRHAALLGKKYIDCNFIVCHIDGGISITAHTGGRMVDATNGGGGDGPLSPTRMGSMAVTDIIKHFDDISVLKDLCSQAGGFTSFFGTSNSDTVHKMLENGNTKATRVWNAMIYQICKEIGAMSAVLEGHVDGILLTGGLLRFDDILEGIKRRCEWMAPVTAYPGEFEQEALAFGALRVLRGEEEAKTYSGKPVWTGFDD